MRAVLEVDGRWCQNLPTRRNCQFFLFRRVSRVKFSYWSRFHVNIITGSGVITIFVYRGFDQKSGNWKYLRLSFVQYLMKSYFILRNCRFTAFTVSELLKENQQGGGGGGDKNTPHPSPRLGLIRFSLVFPTKICEKYKNNVNLCLIFCCVLLSR